MCWEGLRHPSRRPTRTMLSYRRLGAPTRTRTPQDHRAHGRTASGSARALLDQAAQLCPCSMIPLDWASVKESTGAAKPANWPRAGDRPTDPTSRCSVPVPRRGGRCSRQFAVGRKGLSQVTRELVAPSAYFPSIHSRLSVYFPPIGRTKVRKSLQTLAAPVRPCPWLTRRIPCTGLVFPVVTGASNQCPAMGDTGLEPVTSALSRRYGVGTAGQLQAQKGSKRLGYRPYRGSDLTLPFPPFPVEMCARCAPRFRATRGQQAPTGNPTWADQAVLLACACSTATARSLRLKAVGACRLRKPSVTLR